MAWERGYLQHDGDASREWNVEKCLARPLPDCEWPGNEATCSMMGMRAAQRKLRDLLHTLSYEPRESLLQMAGLGASRVKKILQKCEEVGRPLGVQDVLGIPRMGPGTVGSLVGDPLLPAVVKYVLYYQKVVGQNKYTSQEVGRLYIVWTLDLSGLSLVPRLLFAKMEKST